MDIHKKNYEEYVLDFLDHNLSENEHAAMESFFNKHPEIWEEVKDLQNFSLEPEQEFSIDKSNLKRKTKPIGIIQIGMAAAMAAFILFAGIKLMQNQQSVSPNITSVEKDATESESNEVTTKTDNDTQQNIEPKQKGKAQSLKTNSITKIEHTKKQKIQTNNAARTKVGKQNRLPENKGLLANHLDNKVTETINKQLVKEVETVNYNPKLALSITPKTVQVQLPKIEKVQGINLTSTQTNTVEVDKIQVEVLQGQAKYSVSTNKKASDGITNSTQSKLKHKDDFRAIETNEQTENLITKSLLPKSFAYNKKQKKLFAKSLLPKSFGIN